MLDRIWDVAGFDENFADPEWPSNIIRSFLRAMADPECAWTAAMSLSRQEWAGLAAAIAEADRDAAGMDEEARALGHFK